LILCSESETFSNQMMTATMADCALSMVTSWEAQLASQRKKHVTIELSD
jgi:PHYB activation tagged suppressor 1